jgi:hypothetical protein
MNWVQVRHRLPESYKKVLIAWPDNVYIGIQFDNKFQYLDADGTYSPYFEQPMHWAYLPEVPK